MGAALAVIIVLIVLAVAYLATRPLPGPIPAAGPCARDGDCPHPQTCARGACVDAGLPRYLGEAQRTAHALYATTQTAAAQFAAGGDIYGHAESLRAAAVAAGLKVPSGPSAFATLQADLAAGLSAINKYGDTLDSPRCAPACGYHKSIMALTAASPSGVIFATAQGAAGAAAAATSMLSAFPPVAADLKNITDFVASSARGQGKAFDAGISYGAAYDSARLWYDAVVRDTALVNGYPALVAQQADAMSQAGSALYNYLV